MVYYGYLNSSDQKGHSDTVILTVLVVFREVVPLGHSDVFSRCLAARLCAASQDRQTDKALVMCLPSVQEGQT